MHLSHRHRRNVVRECVYRGCTSVVKHWECADEREKYVRVECSA
jgi:hypothetical protein